MRRIRTYAELDGADGSGLADQVEAQQARVDRRMADVRAVLGVASGKGGVGKSFLAASLASALAREGWQTGLLDADLNGPTAAALLGLTRPTLTVTEGAVRPAVDAAGLRIMSTDLLLDEGTPLRWRGGEGDSFLWHGSLERGMVREFLADVAWGELDALVVDLPPGPRRLVELAELVPGRTRILGVTIPTAASGAAVERSLRLALDGSVPVLGLVENMSGHACPECGTPVEMYPGEAGGRLAAKLDLALLARIPFDREAAVRAEVGDMEGLLRTTAGREIGALAEMLMSELARGT